MNPVRFCDFYCIVSNAFHTPRNRTYLILASSITSMRLTRARARGHCFLMRLMSAATSAMSILSSSFR